jgi:hypothetical protein
MRTEEPTVLDQIFPPLPLCILVRHAPDQLRGHTGRPKAHFLLGVFVKKPAALYIATLTDLKRQVLVQNPGCSSLGWCPFAPVDPLLVLVQAAWGPSGQGVALLGGSL